MITVPETDHIPFEVLADYAEGKGAPYAEGSPYAEGAPSVEGASAYSAASITAHLSGCARCAADAAWLRQTFRLMASDDWEEAPLALMQAVIQAYSPSSMPAAQFLSQRRRPVWLPIIAVAIVILIGIGIGLNRSGRFQPPPETQQAAGQPTGLPAAVVAQPAGLVEIKSAGSAVWQPTADKTSLQPGDQVRTRPGATATLPLFDGSTLNLAANTEISLEVAQQTEDGTGRVIVLRQETGQIHYQVQTSADAASRFEINTPTATILVRGTVFDAAVIDNGATTVRVTEGLVAVQAQGRQIEVSAGLTAHVEPGAPPRLAGAETPSPASQPAPTQHASRTPSSTPTEAATYTPSPTPPPLSLPPATDAGTTDLPAPTDVPGLPTEVPDLPTEVPDLPTEVPDSPTDVPGPPTDVPGPPTDVPGPPTDVPGPPTDVPGPPTGVPGPPTDVPGPPTGVPGPPTDVPGPPTGVPGPPTDVPGPPTGVPGPPTDVPGPPTGVPGPPTDVPGPPTGVPGPPTDVPGPPGAPGPTYTPGVSEAITIPDTEQRSLPQRSPDSHADILLLLAVTFLAGGVGVRRQANAHRCRRPPR